MDAEISANRILQQRIINSLLLNASFIDNPGLMHGKMGISIYFYHLARQTQNKIYEDYAGELIDEIYEEITINTPAGFENGLAGIGWGIEYLVLNRIIGLGAYFLKRVQNPATDDEKIPTLTNKQCLIHLIDELERKPQNITEIISEPLSERSPSDNSPNNSRTFEPLNNRQTFELSNESQTLELRNYKQQIGVQRKSRSGGTTNKVFDLTWDYPVLLWFLAELYEQNIFNFKVEKIIRQLFEPLLDYKNLPKLHCNRLLLFLSLTKLQQSTEIEELTKAKGSTRAFKNQELQITLKNLILDLFPLINQSEINSELFYRDFSLRYGSLGIAWIYRQLFFVTKVKKFKEESYLWNNCWIESFTPNQEFNQFFTENGNNTKAFGLLEGLSGISYTRWLLRDTSDNNPEAVAVFIRNRSYCGC